MNDALNNQSSGFTGSNTRDIEESQRNLKDKLTLTGQNLILFKEKYEHEILELKKDIEILKNSTRRVIDFIETLSGEMGKFAKKEDLDILTKQAKMFQPMEFIKKSDLEKLKRNEVL